ncbi:hypothetical protein DFO67_12428 [Modicisalibacter xianhensis]|uniref:Uncharacterized protein n=1 Tax=Modicisalibacter xianhensis TaxID=442341 RepID=A0A4R8FN87_9GAMM|nr:hypothetical protein [Halomonas xianhensis]TDX23711.1 hypothetical protein DFO67_12428 [Halomonas xianhensis]
MSAQAALDTERQIPRVDGFLFFCSSQMLFDLLNAPTALRHGYEEMRTPGWPTWRTFSKLLKSPAAVEGIRPSTLRKLERMAEDIPALQPLRAAAEELEVFWRPYADWTGMIADKCLHFVVSKTYWQARIDKELALLTEIHRVANVQARLRMLLDSELANEPGCRSARQASEKLLSLGPGAETYESCMELMHFRLCALSSTLLRFSAWLLAEWEYLTDTLEARVPLEAFLPKLHCDDETWTNPVKDFLDYLASLADCPRQRSTSAFLGRLWADHVFRNDERGLGRGEDVASKQKLLRNWMAGKGGRPEHRSIYELTRAVGRRLDPSDTHTLVVAAHGCGHALVFLESCRHMLLVMRHIGLPDDMITEVFSVFDKEYLKASHAIALEARASGEGADI